MFNLGSDKVQLVGFLTAKAVTYCRAFKKLSSQIAIAPKDSKKGLKKTELENDFDSASTNPPCRKKNSSREL